MEGTTGFNGSTARLLFSFRKTGKYCRGRGRRRNLHVEDVIARPPASRFALCKTCEYWRDSG